MKKHLKHTKRNHRKTLDNIILIPFIVNQHSSNNLKRLNTSKRSTLYSCGDQFGYLEDNVVPEAAKGAVFRGKKDDIRVRSIYYTIPDLCSALTINNPRSIINTSRIDTALGTWELSY